jgi:nitric oxide reductase NorD protein
MADAPRQNFFNLIRVQKDLEKIAGAALIRMPRMQEVVGEIAELEREAQDFILHWAEVIALSNTELTAHFLGQVPAAFRALDQAAVEDWIIKAMDVFDNRGLGFAIEVFDKLDPWIEAHERNRTACKLEQIAGFLRHFVRALGGRTLNITNDQQAWTDTEKIFLPTALNVLADRAANARLMKSTAVYLWAQNRYGTWRYRALEEAIRQLDAAVTWPVYQCLEGVRLMAAIARELPGLAREMEAVAYVDDAHAASWAAFTAAAAALAAPEASARDSLALVADFSQVPLPAARRWQGEMFPQKVREALFKRVPREKEALQQALSALQPEHEQQPTEDGSEAAEGTQAANRFSIAQNGQAGATQPEYELRYDGQAVPMSAELQDLLDSIMQDMGEMAEDYLTPAGGSGAYPLDESGAGGEGHLKDLPSPAGKLWLYPEWDYARARFRDAFCALTEQDVPEGDPGFAEKTRVKYRGLAKSIQRIFEAILSEAQRQRRQVHGDELDLDALVEAHVDRLQGREMSDRLYTHFRKAGRNVAVMFMVDMSGSTKGWINEAERESLILLCEALQVLGDSYAIYGFSGRTNKRCEIYRVKTFNEPYSTGVERRICGIGPKAYTRMGVAVRHLGKLLGDVPARTRLLITLSDGKPEDYGSYRGRYGIEDTRHALLEIKRSGIHPFCITIDREAQSYLPHMYGASNFTVVDEVAKLPWKVADIYRKLTT